MKLLHLSILLLLILLAGSFAWRSLGRTPALDSQQPIQAAELVGVWRSDAGNTLILDSDFTYQLDAIKGTWSLRQQDGGWSVSLPPKGGLQVWEGPKLIKFLGDPDDGNIVRFVRTAAHPN